MGRTISNNTVGITCSRSVHNQFICREIQDKRDSDHLRIELSHNCKVLISKSADKGMKNARNTYAKMRETRERGFFVKACAIFFSLFPNIYAHNEGRVTGEECRGGKMDG